MAWSVLGLALSLGIAAVAWGRTRSRGGFYDRETYGMDSAAHLRYALLSLGFAAYFGVVYALRFQSAGIAGLALYALIAVFYATSFLQGASDRDE